VCLFQHTSLVKEIVVPVHDHSVEQQEGPGRKSAAFLVTSDQLRIFVDVCHHDLVPLCLSNHGSTMTLGLGTDPAALM